MTRTVYELLTVIGTILKRMDHPHKDYLVKCLNQVQEEFIKGLPPPTPFVPPTTPPTAPVVTGMCPVCLGAKFMWNPALAQWKKCEVCPD